MTIPGEIEFDMRVVQDRARTITMNARNGLIGWFDGMEDMTVIYGHASFEDARTVTVNGERLRLPASF